MNKKEGIRFLTQCADINGKHWYGGYEYPADECYTCNGTNRAGHLRTFSSYGSTSAECAPVAWRLAYLYAKESGEEITYESLEFCMGLVVNDSPEVASFIREYGHRMYR